MRPGLLLAGCLALAAGLPAQAPTAGEGVVVYRAARVYAEPGSDPAWLENGWFAVSAGRVVRVGSGAELPPPLAPLVDLGAAVVIPGLVAADSTLGSRAGRSDRAFGADRLAADDFDSFADMTPVLSRGVTTLYLTPERNRLVGGRGAVVKAAGPDRVLARESDLRVTLAPEAWNPPHYFRPPIPPTSDNPIRPAEIQPPSSRAGALMALRETAAKARSGVAPANVHLRALARFLGSEAPLRVAAEEEGEVAGALQVAREWGKRLIVDGGSGAWRLADRLAAAGAAVVFDVPLFLSLPERPVDERLPDPDGLARLHAAGVPVALGVGRHGRWTWLLEAAAAAVGYGLDEGAALAGITGVPAQLLGVDSRVGSLVPGRDADFVVLSAPPLDPAAQVLEVFIAGEKVWDSARMIRKDEEDPAAVVLRAGTLWTGEGPPITGGAEVLLEDGRVAAVGRSVPHPPGARVVDAGPGAHITPGFIDALGHLGLAGGPSSTPPRLDLGWLADTGRFEAAWRAVARAGVTTMVLSPSKVKDGQRLQAAKTAAGDSLRAYVAERQLVRFMAAGGDRASRAEGLEKKLKAGQAYFKKWESYRAERAKWESEQAEKHARDREQAEAKLRERLARGKPEEDAEKAEEEIPEESGPAPEEEKQAVDPVNGLWEAVIEDPRLPEPITVHARLRHEGARVTGLFSSPQDPSGETVELEGSFEDNVVRFELPTDFGSVIITGEIDSPDHMNCRVELTGLGSADFEAFRIETDEGGEDAVSRPRRRAKAGEGPQPPKKDWNKEGLRALFEGRAVALVEARRADEIRAAVEVFGRFELPVVILGGDDAEEVADVLREKGVGVVVPPALVQRKKNRDVVPAARLLARGVSVAFQSDANTGSRYLPQALALAVRYGLGAEQALAGLTSGAARLLGIQERVGRLTPGLDADAVILDGPPFDLRTRVLRVFVNGREVPSR